MAKQFYIQLTLKTKDGPEGFAKFFLGNRAEHAYEIFEKLDGSVEVNEQQPLYVELIETREGLPLNVNMLTCSLDQLGENCKIIARELFKIHSLRVSN